LERTSGRTKIILAETEADSLARQKEIEANTYHQDYLRAQILTELLRIRGRTQEVKDGEAAEHELRMKEIIRDQAHLDYVRANAQVHLAQTQAATTLDEYTATITEALIAMKEALEKDERGYKIGLKWFWTNFELFHEILATELERGLFADELAVKMLNLLEGGRDDCKVTRASAHIKTEAFSAKQQWRYITKG